MAAAQPGQPSRRARSVKRKDQRRLPPPPRMALPRKAPRRHQPGH